MHNILPSQRIVPSVTFQYMQRRGWLLIVTCIFLLALVLRVWDLHTNPPGLFADEASVGYNAYRVLTTGRDEFGESLPLFFKTFGHYKGPFEVYSVIPMLMLFGLSVEAVRLTSVVIGLFTMLALYIVGYEYRSRMLGVLFAGVYAVMPWAIHLNRTGFTANNLMVLYVTASLIPLQRYVKGKKPKDLMLFAMVSGFATYTYFPARLLVPVFVSCVLIYAWMRVKESLVRIVQVGFVFSVILIPLVVHMFLGDGLERWNEVSIWNHPDINPTEHILNSVTLHFSPDFLFVEGDAGLAGQFVLRHSILGVGELYLWQAPLLLVGFAWLIKRDKRALGLVVLFMLLYPIPSAISLDKTPQATRSILGILPLTLLTGIGLYGLIQKLRSYNKQYVLGLFAVLCAFGMTYELVRFIDHFEEYPLLAADYWGWQYGGEEIMGYVVGQGDAYDQYLLTGMFNGAHVVYAFFDPKGLCSRCIIQGVESHTPLLRQLFVMREHEYQQNIAKGYNFAIQHEVYLPNGRREFVFAEVKGKI